MSEPGLPEVVWLGPEPGGRSGRPRRWPRLSRVAQATALALGPVVRSLALIEPATIGDDDWSASEAAWRARMEQIVSFPDAEYRAAFRQEMMPPGVPPPGQYHATIRRVGFESEDLRALVQPVLVVTGGQSHPRFADVAARLEQVLPDARTATFPDCHHLRAPHRHEPDRLAALLLALWHRQR